MLQHILHAFRSQHRGVALYECGSLHLGVFIMRMTQQVQKRKRIGIILLLMTGAVVAAINRTRKSRSALIRGDLIPSPAMCPWRKIKEEGDSQAFLAVTGLTRPAFAILAEAFGRHYTHHFTTKKGGRPARLVDKDDALALVLRFYVEPVTWKALAQIHGLPESTLNRTLMKAEKALHATVKDLPLARISWPTLEQQELWARLVARKEPLVQGRWGFVDGKNLRVQKPSDAELQCALYNGWLHAVLVTGCLLFGADGCIAWYKHNVVGSINDAEISRGLQAKLQRDEINKAGHGVLADTAFPVSAGLKGRIMTPAKEGEIERAPRNQQYALTRLSAAITAVRQAAEWGMGAVEKPFQRLKQPLSYNSATRARRLATIFHLYNFRVRTTGISQIRSHFFG